MTNDEIKKSILIVLDKLVSPKYNGKIEYDVFIGKDNIRDKLLYLIEVNVENNNYWKMYDESKYDDPQDFDHDIAFDVKRALMYLGINRPIINVFAV